MSDKKIEKLVDNLMVMVSQSMHYKNQTDNEAPSLTKDAEGGGYYHPLCGTVLKVGNAEALKREYIAKIKRLIQATGKKHKVKAAGYVSLNEFNPYHVIPIWRKLADVKKGDLVKIEVIKAEDRK